MATIGNKGIRSMSPKNISPDGLAKQDKVNNAYSPFIILIILLISQMVRVVRLVWYARIARMNKGLAYRAPRGQGVRLQGPRGQVIGLKGPKGSRGRPTVSQWVKE